MHKWIFVAVSMLVSGHAFAAAPSASQAAGARLAPTELTTWPRMRATDFGCMLEKRFGVQDKKFGCAADFDRIDWGDGCDGGGNYHAGPELPARVAKTLPAPIKSVEIVWEHGEAQYVSIDFDPGTSKHEIEVLMGLGAGKQRPANVMDVSITECAGDNNCTPNLFMLGFDHMGAGDLECDKLPAKKKR
ncbi:hypothetical protein [Lysobacter sp. Root690]|uniref:hypothetical protein n=1 Tax=Lysobacter sp. Root690 TaxID=1736588 RepID=UPI0012F9F295|nr:hypothetical protein [Lysobacter sp. Root690]